MNSSLELKKEEIKEDNIESFVPEKVNSGDITFQLRRCWARIQNLQKHLKVNKKDYYSKLTLAKLLARRRKHLNYLKRRSLEGYKAIMREQSSKGRHI